MIKFLDHAAKEYYEGTPCITDAEFDALAAKYSYEAVGHVTGSRIPHLYKMASLQKRFTLEDPPIPLDKAVETPKLDGAAVSLMYVHGCLLQALTRGDGEYGLDITDKMMELVPSTITTTALTQICGEVVAKSEIPNARNYASGALNLKDTTEFRKRDLVFVAYSMTPNDFVTYDIAMMSLKSQGFHEITTFDSSEYPTDGLVFRINNNAMYDVYGETSHHPKGAFAFKTQQEGVETTLLDVIWQVGKSGVVSPVAILEPVKVGDATVSKATLHNIEYIEGLGLELGCQVEVIRSGEIIPRIVRRLD